MMEALRIALHTPQAGFANEFCDVLKLFYRVEAFVVNPETGGDWEPLVHTYVEQDGVATSGFAFRGQSLSRQASLPDSGDDPQHRAIVEKRVRKRLC